VTGRIACLGLALVGTAVSIGPGHLLAPARPLAAYVFQLLRTGAADSTEARAWLDAGDAILRDAAEATPPFRQTNALGGGATDRQALGIRVSVPRGRRLSIAVAFDASAPAPLFVDLFRVEPGEGPRLVGSMSANRRTLVHDVDASADYVIRAQTQVGVSGEATVAVRTLASLPFPIGGVEGRMQSGFGVARDAGRRQHEGIDIFAPRGTPVRAVAGGIARAGSNRLGGTVVWLYAPGERRTFYYAHLDRHAVGAMTLVRRGDVLGYVGNSGNARTTAPHLHFGIYEHGAVDPWPFVQPDQPIPRLTPARPLSSTGRPRPRSGRRRRA
jgi:murein DD-endopeptidase MepM/ murein hydrolase activator NlpD